MGDPAQSLRLFLPENPPTQKPAPAAPRTDLPGQQMLFASDVEPTPVSLGSAAVSLPFGDFAGDPDAKGHGHGVRHPSPSPQLPVTVSEVCAAALDYMRSQIAAGERAQRSIEDYQLAVTPLLQVFGGDREVASLRPDDFRRLRKHLDENLSKRTLKKRIGAIRTVLKYADDLRDETGERRFSGQIDYGREFNRPSSKVLRQEKLTQEKKYFEPQEVRRLLAAAREPVRTMILLALNCGFGNTDIATLTWSVIELDSTPSWIEFPRGKTAIERRCPLWPETAAALRIHRGTIILPPEALVFLTSRGNPWVRMSEKKNHDDALGKAFHKLQVACDLKRHGVGFYSLRHCFETWGGETKDQVAVNDLMGHVDTSMAGEYREAISDTRKQAVVDEVRRRLWPDAV